MAHTAIIEARLDQIQHIKIDSETTQMQVQLERDMMELDARETDIWAVKREENWKAECEKAL